MTSRLLLTLLALLTGLSAQGSPVHARAMTATTTQVAAVTALATVQDAKARAGLARPAGLPVGAWMVRRAPRTGAGNPALPSSVLLRIDRARE